MEARRIFWDVKARDSLKDIFFYLRLNASLQIAKRVRDSIVAEVKAILPYPEKGALEPWLTGLDGEFCFKVIWNYKIIYEVRPEAVYILDIFHTSRSPVSIRRD